MTAKANQPSCSTYNLFGFNWPTISTGIGIPVDGNQPDGSLFLRADPPDAAHALYVSVAGVWTAK